jgi:hypothetical protein
MSDASRFAIMQNETRFRILTGDLPVPPGYTVTEACKNGHGVGGKTLRYRDGHCVYCNQEAGARRAHNSMARPYLACIDSIHIDHAAKAATREVWE